MRLQAMTLNIKLRFMFNFRRSHCNLLGLWTSRPPLLQRLKYTGPILPWLHQTSSINLRWCGHDGVLYSLSLGEVRCWILHLGGINAADSRSMNLFSPLLVSDVQFFIERKQLGLKFRDALLEVCWRLGYLTGSIGEFVHWEDSLDVILCQVVFLLFTVCD